MATSARNMAPVKLPVVLKAHPTVILLALFALAFAGSLFVLKWADAPAAASAVAMGGEQPLPGAGSPGHSVADAGALETSGARDGAASNGEADGLDAAMTLSPAAHPGATTPAESGATAPPAPMPLAAPDDLAASLPADPLPPDDIAQTLDTLSEGAPEDRVAAIQSLAATAHSGRAFARVRQSLRLAAADEDPNIAARAQEAYELLLNRDDP